MTITLIFEKTVAVKYDIVNYPADTTAALVRPYTDLLVVSSNTDTPPQVKDFDATQISVFYNGQELGTTTTSKYFYSVTATPASPSTATLTGFTITIHANQSYTSPGYVGQTAYALLIGPNDLFFLNYTYTIYS